jgi:hypothetical protein
MAELEVVTRAALQTCLSAFLPDLGTWPYALENGGTVVEPEQVSMSTTAMICFALRLVTGGIQQSSLAPSIGDPLGEDKDGDRVKESTDLALKRLAVLSRDHMAEILMKRKEGGWPDPSPNPPATESATFGWDDPFTLTWLVELLAGETDEDLQQFSTTLSEHAEALISRVAKDPATPVLQLRAGESVSHAFPLLRVLQLARVITRTQGKTDISDIADLGLVRDYLLRRIHLQLSESHIADGGFDAADLVFSLEGWMLTSEFEPDLSVVSEVFRVLQTDQERASYWRPLRPFKATSQGLILLPQSVELANSLLRICSDPKLESREYFSHHLDLLRRYTQWLQGRVFRGKTRAPKAYEFTGWESEHTYTEDRIHLWQTSQVLIYLHHYAAMLQQHIARTLLRLTPLVPQPQLPQRWKRPSDPEEALRAWEDGEPLSLESGQSPYRVYHRIADEFITPRFTKGDQTGLVSMLLYGPPGTGKSSLAKGVAELLGFPLLTITPSDFLTAGGEAVEARAKAIFQVLAEQRDTVVLFDEIDNLLLDRDSKLYHDQGDVFKLLTPGMLTKLNRLAEQKRVIFIVANNYFERIDPAIKRPGRIDASYLVLPPGLARRRERLAQKLGLTGDELDEAAASTMRFTYRELDDLVGFVDRRLKEAPDLKSIDLVRRRIREAPAMITLESYARRLGYDWDDTRQEVTDSPDLLSVDRPWSEVALLTYLECEVGAWPDEPPWLQNAVIEALKRDAVRDDEVAGSLRGKMPKTEKVE